MTDWPAVSSGRKIRPSHITGLQDAVDGIQSGTLPIALPGIAGALGEYGPLVNMRATVYNLLDFPGIDPSGLTDSTEGIQNAINTVQTHIATLPFGRAVIAVHPGRYAINDTLTVRSAAFSGMSRGAMAAEMRWDGPTDRPAIAKSLDPGGTSFGYIGGFRLRPGTAQPLSWIDLTGEGTVVDVFMQLEHLHFIGGQRQIEVGYWANLQWSHLRFDDWLEYAITLDPPSTQFLASFVLDKFTADNYAGPLFEGGGKAFMRLAVEASNPGTIHLSNARIEINKPFDAPNSLVHLVHPSDTANGSSFMFSNVMVSPASGCQLGSWFYQDSVTELNGPRILLNGCQAAQFGDPVVAGNNLNESYVVPTFPQGFFVLADRVNIVGY